MEAIRKFIIVHFGSYGKEGDAGILMKSNLFKKIQIGEVNIPAHAKMAGTEIASCVFG